MNVTAQQTEFLSWKVVPARLDANQALGLCAEPLGWLEHGDGEAPRDVRAEPSVWGDVLLARKDVPTSYAISVVVDDALQGVTDVVRGLDLLAEAHD